MVGNKFFRMAAGLVLVTAASAQIYPPSQGDLVVSVPFEFEVAGKVMPAGEYIVHHDVERGALQICEDGVYCSTVPAQRLAAGLDTAAPGLTFYRNGERFALMVVDCGE